MNQSIKILLIIISVIIVVVLGFYALLYPFSPRSVKADIYALKFMGEGWEKRYQIQGDQFTCQQTESYPSTTCTTIFEGKQLTINIAYTDDTRHLASWCRMTYDGKAVDCEPSINYEHDAPTLITRDMLGITPERFQVLRRENLMLYWHENQWIQLAGIVSGLAALVITMWRWLHFPSDTPKHVGSVSRLLISLLIGFFSWMGLALGLNSVASLLSISGISAYWRFIPLAALVGAAVAFVWEWHILDGWKPEMVVLRFIYSVGGGLITFSILAYLLVGDLLFLGFVD
jgi:hypothetical protein